MNCPQRGFTLIEVMVALLLMALMSIIAWRGLDSITRTDQHLQAIEQDNAQLWRVLNQLDRDIAMRVTTELDSPALPAEPPVPKPLAQVLRLQGTPENGRLRLVRSAPALDGTLQQVQWWLQDGVLYRAASAGDARLPLGEPATAIAVLDRVTALRLRVWRDGKGWVRWSPKTAINPRGLEVVLVRNGEQGQEPYRRVFGPLGDPVP
ncbi:type II secretion system protein GspJ [Pseudomonas huanghezhanensis]|uniref:type II secretion system protein GspJ n=1 Tax=Pseudomonas huanghezhanensis TaxID=3002903 RepID=UPI002285EE5A|nr:type II secretion system protein GspJ [Pseudomonas sp. BSw22131]